MAADGRCERDVVHRMNEGNRAWEAMKSVLSNRGPGIKAKKCLYEGVIVPSRRCTEQKHGGMRSAERKKVNILEVRCLRSLVGVSRMDRVRNEEVRRRAGIERELASRADQRVLRCLGHVERMDVSYGEKGADCGSKWRAGTRETEVRLDGWCEGGFGQERNDGGGCASMSERSERVESSGTYVTE